MFTDVFGGAGEINELAKSSVPYQYKSVRICDSAAKTKDSPQMATDKQRIFTDIFWQSLGRQCNGKIICVLSFG